jgi:hypothetical protein
MVKSIEMKRVEVTLFLRTLAVCSTTRNSRTPFRPTTRSVCLSRSGRAEFEELGRSVPDSTSEADIWEDCMKEGKRTALQLGMPKSPRIPTTCLIGKDLCYKRRSTREIGPDR